jgi:hypothetical protein
MVNSREHEYYWPELDYSAWKDTCATVHRWTQCVGKVRLVQTPWINHSWHVTQYVTTRGLTTSPIPYGERLFQIDFDFVDHRVLIATGEGDLRIIELAPRSVANFHTELFSKLTELGIDVEINPIPSEIPDGPRLDRDEQHATYDREYADRFRRVLLSSARVMQKFRSRYIGKVSPVHFFWGSFDLAVTRFSGRTAPPHPGGVPHLPLAVAREAYSHEVSSAGFWPGGIGVDFPAYYSYAYPTPEGFSARKIRPAEAYFDKTLGEFLLPYNEVRRTSSPDDMLLDFFQTTYEAAAELADWNRSALEHDFAKP